MTLPSIRTSRAATLILALGLVTRHAGGQTPQDTETSRTEPVVTRTEASLLRNVEQVSEKDLPAAVQTLREAIQPTSSAALDFTLGVLLSRGQSYREAEAAFARAVAKMPHFVRAWDHLGRIRLTLDRPREAAAAFLRALRHASDTGEFWKLLGYCYLLTEHHVAADTAYRQALARRPEDRDVAVGLAKTLLVREHFRDALSLLEVIASREPRSGDVWKLEANAHFGLGHPDRGLVTLETARRLGVIDTDAQLTLADLYYNKGLYAVAAQRYDEAHRSGKVTADRMLRSARAFFRAGRTDTAAAFLKRARRGALEQPADAMVLAGKIAEARSDLDAAGAAYESALEAAPMHGDALLRLGELYWKTSALEKAEITLERATRVTGFEVRAHILLAQVSVERERYRRAIEHLEAALEREPSRRLQRYLEQIRRLTETGD